MQGNALDSSKLIVSWNRYEQSLMKRHLMKCINDDSYCFGNENEVKELYGYLVKHGILLPQVNYKYTNFQQLVDDIKNVIRNNLTKYQGHRNFDGASDFSINNDAETFFLTKFAMAIQDTKIRGTFIPESVTFANNTQCPNLSRATSCSNSVTLAKAKLLSLATQLTRIGLNCKTTVHHAQNLRGPTQNAGLKRTINFIDTNNFLGKGALQMDKLGIGMNADQYYFQLYRKLFDFALKREWDQKLSGKRQKIPRFLIPLTQHWGAQINTSIKTALEALLKIPYNKTQTYGQLIAVDILDYNRQTHHYNDQLFNKGNWKYGRIIDNKFREPLFNQQETYEDYAIGSGDHYTFIGNECMDCWKNNGASASSHEAFAMKTDFPKFYGQKQGFANNGYYIINKDQFRMPTDYQLHMNYQNDRIVPMNGINKGINYNTKYGTNNYYNNGLNNNINY